MTELDYQLLAGSTSEVSQGDAADFWTHHVSLNHGCLRYHFESRDFAGVTRVQRLSTYRLGEPQLVEFNSKQITYRRTAREIRTDDDHTVRLVIVERGRIGVTQGDRSAVLSRGQMAVIDWGQPMELAHDDQTWGRIVTLPADVLPRDFKDRPSLLLSAEADPILGSARARVDLMVAHRESLTPRQFVHLSTTLAHDVRCALDEVRSEEHSALIRLAEHARVLISTRYMDASLDVPAIASHLGCSRRKLELAVQKLGTTPGALLRDARLEHASRLLMNPRERQSLSDIAFASGFGSLASFTRSFKARYSMTPRSYRLERPGR